MKAEEFTPTFARRLIWAPVLSRKDSSEPGSWAKIKNSKAAFFYSQDLVQDKMVIQQLDQNHHAAMDILPRLLHVKQEYWWFYFFRKEM